jgi:hypothetical protein
MADRALSLVMIGAMYENGGNTTHRHLDGHPALCVYPYESQIGTRMVADHYSSMFPAKYRWPVFDLASDAAADYHAIIDEETKVRTRTPQVSKFRDWQFQLDDDDRKARFIELVNAGPRTRHGNVVAFFRATFDCWRDRVSSGVERYYVGYSPVLVVDAETMLDELPDSHFVHVVRNPWSAYADTKRRPVPLKLSTYVQQWVVNQHAAHVAQQRFPERMHIVRLEDVVSDPAQALAPLCRALGIDAEDPALRRPSWNSTPIEQVYPWGTIRTATPEANVQTGRELDAGERAEVARVAGHWVKQLGYANVLD